MKIAFQQVTDFHRAFQVEAPPRFTLADQKTRDLRVRLIKEEFKEYMDAVEKAIEANKHGQMVESDVAEIADALCDLCYVVIGTAVAHGFTRFGEMFDEVQRSNMSKLGRDGKPVIREDGKVMKGPNFTLPDLEQFLEPDLQLEFKL